MTPHPSERKIYKIRRQIEKTGDHILPELRPQGDKKLFGCDLTDSQRAIFNTYQAKVGQRLALRMAAGSTHERRSTADTWQRLKNHKMLGSNVVGVHDTMHFVAQRVFRGKPTLPAFLSPPEPHTELDKSLPPELHQLINQEVIEEEMYALLWGGTETSVGSFFLQSMQGGESLRELTDMFTIMQRYGADSGILLNLNAMHRVLDNYDPQDFDQVYEVYSRMVYAATYGTVIKVLRSFVDNTQAVQSALQLFHELFEGLVTHPDPDMLSVFKRVFDEYPKNPQVLFDIFAEGIQQ